MWVFVYPQHKGWDPGSSILRKIINSLIIEWWRMLSVFLRNVKLMRLLNRFDAVHKENNYKNIFNKQPRLSQFNFTNFFLCI